MVTIEVKEAKLVSKKNQTEYSETEVFAECYPVGRDENNSVKQDGFKASFRADVWASEFNNQPFIEIEGLRYDIYRTYGPKPNGKVELYAREKAGKK